MKKIENYTNKQNGLSKQEVESRITNGKINTQEDSVSKTYKQIFQENLFTIFNLINIVLAVLVLLVHEYRNALFLGTMISNIFIGIIQEVRAKRTLDKLSIVTQSKIDVLRDGCWINIPTDQVVLDDICKLEMGQQISCDAVVVDGKIEVNESLITGESDSIIKGVEEFLYSGSMVVSGQAIVQVVNVGKDNYAKRIVDHAKSYKRYASQLRDSLNAIIKVLGIIIIPLGIAMFYQSYSGAIVEGVAQYDAFRSAVLSTVAAITGMIPEGLVLLTSVALAVSTVNLARRKVLVQELYSIESLARVDVICLDKTGTITQGAMAVEAIETYKNGCNVSSILGNMMRELKDNNATATAIRAFAKDDNSMLVRAVLPFSSERKTSAVEFQGEGTYILGAYEFIEGLPSSYQENIYKFTKNGYRALVLAHTPSSIEEDSIPSTQIEIIGVILLSDPLRDEAPATLQYFASQGVDVKIISGDDPTTVSAIAKKAGVSGAENYIDMSKVVDEDIARVVKENSVFGRVSPIQKRLMVESLNAQGHVSAMMGDGVNDVMALKEANVSISVSGGSEAAKNIANLVLLDDNFASIPKIVDEGRRVINNIQRAASMFLVKTIFSVSLSLIAIFFTSGNYIFMPIQLSLISTLIVGGPSFFLALESNHQIVKGKFLYNVIGRAFPGAFAVNVSVFFAYLVGHGFGYDIKDIQTIAVLLTAICYYVVLYRVSVPFSTKRRIVLYTSLTIFCILVFVPQTRELFMLEVLNAFQITLVVAFGLLIPIIMNFLYYYIEKLLDYATKRHEKKKMK